MPDDAPVTRDAILRTCASALEPLPFVDAMWEGGAAAFDRLDAWSDTDLYAVVEDDRVAETFRVVDAALSRLSPIRRKYMPVWPPHTGIAQAFYRLERASEFLLVDLAVLKRSAPDKYLEPEMHGTARFLFNKGGAVKEVHLDEGAFVAKVLEARERCIARVALFGPFVAKELCRKNGLGALEAYRRIVLDALVQVLWMRYVPVHFAFGVRYVPHELPDDVARRLEDLSYVGSPSELTDKCRQAIEWFRGTVEEVTEPGVRAALHR